MIVDKLMNANQYSMLNENLKKGFDFLLNSNLENLKEGKHTILGDDIFALVQTLTTKQESEKKWEKHKKYIDIQCIIKGTERFGYGFLEDFKKVIVPYDDKKDIEFLDGDKFNFLNLKKGEFVIFYPDDIHAPMLSVEDDIEIKKVIVKVRI